MDTFKRFGRCKISILEKTHQLATKLVVNNENLVYIYLKTFCIFLYSAEIFMAVISLFNFRFKSLKFLLKYNNLIFLLKEILYTFCQGRRIYNLCNLHIINRVILHTLICNVKDIVIPFLRTFFKVDVDSKEVLR